MIYTGLVKYGHWHWPGPGAGQNRRDPLHQPRLSPPGSGLHGGRGGRGLYRRLQLGRAKAAESKARLGRESAAPPQIIVGFPSKTPWSITPLLTIQIDLLLLLLIASLAAVILTRLQFPYTVGLVLLGLLLGGLADWFPALDVLNSLNLSHDLILFVFVPPLIFESAINLDGRLLLRNLTPVLTLAGPGLLISTAIVGAIVTWGTPLTLGQALLFGSLISATDPVAVNCSVQRAGGAQATVHPGRGRKPV